MSPPRRQQPPRVAGAFEVCPTRVLSGLELSVDLQTLSAPPTSPSIKGRAIRTGQRWKPFTASLPLPAPPPSSPAAPEAAGLQKLPRQEIYCAYGGVGVGGGGGGVCQSSVSNVRHNLEVKDTGEGRGSAPPRRDAALLLSLFRLPVRLVVESKAAPPGCVVRLQHLLSVHGRRERGAAFQGGICRLAHLQVLLPADNKTMLLRCHY